jgi:hypothetical protein
MMLLSPIFPQEFLHKHLFINLQIFLTGVFKDNIHSTQSLSIQEGVLQYRKYSLKLHHNPATAAPATATPARCQVHPH